MDPGMVAAFGIAVALPLAIGRWVRPWWLNGLIAAPLSVIVLLAISWVHLGYLEPFFTIALMVGTPMLLPVTLASAGVAAAISGVWPSRAVACDGDA